jgi:DNA-directed RNA polymerase specialized sigma subunit
MTRKDLKRYQFLCKKLSLIAEEHQRLLDQAYPGPIVDGMPHAQSKSDRVGKLSARRVDMLRDYEKIEERLMKQKMEIEAAVNGLDEEKETLVLKLYYLDGLPWKGVADKMDYGIDNIFKIHKRALIHLSGDTVTR